MRTAYWAINQEKKETYMSKNLTRKGLALGAVIALGTSLFAGAPAFATGGTISLASSFGTGTKTILGSTFQLSSTFVGATAAPGAALKYFVTGVAAGDLINVQSGMNTDLTTPFSTSTSATATTSPTGVTLDPLDISALGNYGHLRFALDTTKVTATTTVSVTAFYDNVVADGKITAGEIASSAVSVTFVRPSEVTAVTTMAAPIVGATTAAPKITLGDINLQQVTAGVVRAVVTRNGVAATGVNALWNTTDASLNASVTGLNAATATDVYSARAEILDLGKGANATGTPSATFTANGTASSLATGSAGAFEVGVGAITANDKTVVSGTSIRAKATTYAFKSQVTVVPAASKNVKAGAGIPAKVIISGRSGMGTSTFTLGGKTISASSTADLEWDTTTDATGLVNFTITGDKAVAGESFIVTVQALDKTSGYVSTTVDAAGTVGASNATTYTFATPVATLVARPGLVGNEVLSTTRGGNVSFDVVVYDQFGAPFQSANGYRVFAATSGAQASGATVSTSALTTAGKATISYTDTSSVNGLTTLALTVFEQTTPTSGVYTTAVNPSSTASVNVAVYTVTSTAVSVVTGTNTSNGSPAIEYGDMENVDTRTGGIAPTLTTTAQTIAGSALAANGSALPGVPVTITLAGAQFNTSAGTWKTGSITVMTDANGAYSVSYRSQKAGKQTLVITSGSATRSVDSSTFAAAARAAINGVVITGAATVPSGRSSVYTVKIVDEWGNTVEDAGAVSVSYTGPGYFTTDLGAITAFGAKGTLTFTLIAGAADQGAGTLTVTSSGADNATATDAQKKDNAVATQAIQIGAAPVVAPAGATARIAGSTNRFFVSVDGNTSARNVVVKVAGRTFATLKGSATNRSYSVRAPKGSHKVTVFVGGKLIGTRTIVVR
jgi:trimeric autotransporter adhesin